MEVITPVMTIIEAHLVAGFWDVQMLNSDHIAEVE